MAYVYDINGNVINETDKTLTVENAPADAKATGAALKNFIPHVEPEPDDIPSLYFTGRELPQSKEEGKVEFKVEYVSNTLNFTEYCTLKLQGDSSLVFPKKNFNIQFYKASNLEKKSKHEFKNWGNESKYTLKANWADPTHARNVVNANIWADMVRERSNYDELPTELLESPNLAVVDGFPVKVYWNGVYLGRYTLNIPKDKWMFNMDDELETNAVLYAEGRGSDNPATNFRETVKVDGRDWSDEIHEDEVPQSVIDRFNAFITFVINSTDTEFSNGINSYVDLESLLDVVLFAWVDCGLDSLHKNQVFLTYDGIKYYGSVYDLDSTWGMIWNGQIANPYNTPLDSLNYVRNNLYNRIKALFSKELKERYAYLRKNALSEANIAMRFSEFSKNMTRELAEQDWAETTANGKYTEIPSKTESTIPNILNYMTKRLAYIDEEFTDMYPKITVSYNAGTNTVYMQDGIDTLKQYMTVTYYTDENSAGEDVAATDCELSGDVVAGSVPITVRYNGYTGYFTAIFTDFYDQNECSYPNGNAILQMGYPTRGTVWGSSHLLMSVASGQYTAVTTKGVRPFLNQSTTEDMDVYPIPVPDGVNKISISVIPSNIEIKPSLWSDMSSSGRYARTQDPGILGSGNVVWENIQRSETYHEYLCVNFVKTGGTIAEGEITSFDIQYEAVN